MLIHQGKVLEKKQLVSSLGTNTSYDIQIDIKKDKKTGTDDKKSKPEKQSNAQNLKPQTNHIRIDVFALNCF